MWLVTYVNPNFNPDYDDLDWDWDPESEGENWDRWDAGGYDSEEWDNLEPEGDVDPAAHRCLAEKDHSMPYHWCGHPLENDQELSETCEQPHVIQCELHRDHDGEHHGNWMKTNFIW